jgi:hypothetical protein
MIGEAKDGAVRVEVNGNGVVTDIKINGVFSNEEISGLVIIAANRALEQANRVKEMEMAQSAKGIMPGL